jgi:hypothetical protein
MDFHLRGNDEGEKSVCDSQKLRCDCPDWLLILDITCSIILAIMNTAAKLLESMKSNPRDWRIEQLQTVARHHGIVWRQDGTSHCYFRRADGAALAVPAHRPIKPAYVREFVKLVKGA